MIKILYLSHSGEMVGGGQKNLLYILERIDKKIFEPLVIAPSKGSFIDRISKLNIPSKYIKMEKLNVRNLSNTIPEIIKIIRMEKIDLIYTDSPRGVVYGGISAKITRIPFIYHAKVSDNDKLDELNCLLSTKIIAVSKAAAKRFKNAQKVEIIYNAIDLDEFNPNIDGTKIKKELNVDNILIGTIGQLIPEKGQKDLLLVVPDILKVYPNVKFIIVGNGNDTYVQELKKLCRDLEISNNVIFTGFRNDIPKIIAAIDIFVLLTANEGLCRTILEVMATGKPVITTNVGGNPETVVNDVTGVLLPPLPAHNQDENNSILKNALLELIRDEQKRKEMGNKARKRAEEFFNIEENIRKIEKIYLETLENTE